MNDNEKEFILPEEGYNSYSNNEYIDKVIEKTTQKSIKERSEIIDTFRGNRACCKPDSIMNTHNFTGDFVYYKRNELYDK